MFFVVAIVVVLDDRVNEFYWINVLSETLLKADVRQKHTHGLNGALLKASEIYGKVFLRMDQSFILWVLQINSVGTNLIQCYPEMSAANHLLYISEWREILFHQVSKVICITRETIRVVFFFFIFRMSHKLKYKTILFSLCSGAKRSLVLLTLDIKELRKPWMTNPKCSLFPFKIVFQFITIKNSNPSCFSQHYVSYVILKSYLHSNSFCKSIYFYTYY